MGITSLLSFSSHTASTYQVLARLSGRTRCRFEMDVLAKKDVTIIPNCDCIVVNPTQVSLLHVLVAGQFLRRSQSESGREAGVHARRTRELWCESCAAVVDRFRSFRDLDWTAVRTTTSLSISSGKVERTPPWNDPDVLDSYGTFSPPFTLSLDNIDWGNDDAIANLMEAVREGEIPTRAMAGFPEVGLARVPVTVPANGNLQDRTLKRMEVIMRTYEKEAQEFAQCRREQAGPESVAVTWRRSRSGSRFHRSGLHDAAVASHANCGASPYAKRNRPASTPFDPEENLNVMVLDLAALTAPSSHIKVSEDYVGVILRAMQLLETPLSIVCVAGFEVDESRALELILQIKEHDEPFDSEVTARLGRIMNWNPWSTDKSPAQHAASHFELIGDLADEILTRHPSIHSLDVWYFGAMEAPGRASPPNYATRTTEAIDARLGSILGSDVRFSGSAVVDRQLREHARAGGFLSQLIR